VKIPFIALMVLCSLTAPAFAQSYLGAQNSDSKHYLLAQTDPDEAYDPFSDYSEFDEASDEEADINFFRNGRFFTVGLTGGMRGFTGNFGKAYQSAPSYGIFLSYFFDLRLALSLGFLTGDNAAVLETASRDYNGNASFTSFNFDLKYYFNTQNVTRGLADLNPYLIGGLAQYYRTYTFEGLEGYGRDATMGIELGVGLEVPLMRKKAYLGIQAMYHYVNFKDENGKFLNDGTSSVPLKYSVSGDIVDALIILGMNF